MIINIMIGALFFVSCLSTSSADNTQNNPLEATWIAEQGAGTTEVLWTMRGHAFKMITCDIDNISPGRLYHIYSYQRMNGELLKISNTHDAYTFKAMFGIPGICHISYGHYNSTPPEKYKKIILHQFFESHNKPEQPRFIDEVFVDDEDSQPCSPPPHRGWDHGHCGHSPSKPIRKLEQKTKEEQAIWFLNAFWDGHGDLPNELSQIMHETYGKPMHVTIKDEIERYDEHSPETDAETSKRLLAYILNEQKKRHEKDVLYPLSNTQTQWIKQVYALASIPPECVSYTFICNGKLFYLPKCSG